jgi:sulfite reductase (NADPH) flavoprotein alpha-component
VSSAAANQIPSSLSRDKLTRLQQAASDFSHDELVWASGYLAGLAATAKPQVAAHPAPVSESGKAARTLAIVYGSQTGNSKRLAETLHKQAVAAQLPAKLVNIADLAPRQLKNEVAALFVVSTQGDGDPPEDAVALFDYLLASNAPRLEKLKFGVLALGDSSYPYFCQAGRKLDERLAELGASRVLPRIDCDLDYSTQASQWSDQALKQIAETVRTAIAPRIAIVDTGPKTSVDTAVQHHSATAELLVNQRLTGRDSSKDVRHLEFALESAAVPYAPGDSLAVLPQNPRPVVDAVLAALGASGDEPIGNPANNAAPPRQLVDVLTREVELTLLSRQFLVAYQARANHPVLAEILDSANPAKFADYLSNHQVIDVLRDAPTAWRPDEFVHMLRPLARRTYSIASSNTATPDEAHLLVALVQDSHGSELRYGAASNFLADLPVGTQVELHLEPNHNFRLPNDPDAPIIMIGPGTGVAPFRAFVAERAAQGAPGRNWLFFGERNFREDFLYQLEWQKALAAGTLQRLDVAFSRDQAAKVYVQDRIREQARDLYAWLQDGATVYVCGDAKHMAKDVHAALHAAIESAAGVNADGAREYMQDLQRNGRYRRDVY